MCGVCWDLLDAYWAMACSIYGLLKFAPICFFVATHVCHKFGLFAKHAPVHWAYAPYAGEPARDPERNPSLRSGVRRPTRFRRSPAGLLIDEIAFCRLDHLRRLNSSCIGGRGCVLTWSTAPEPNLVASTGLRVTRCDKPFLHVTAARTLNLPARDRATA